MKTTLFQKLSGLSALILSMDIQGDAGIDEYLSSII